MKLPTLGKLNVRGKRVLLRLDLDAPMVRDRVVDDTRLRASIPTIKYLVEKKCGRIIVLGHRGRPGGKTVNSLSISPVAQHLGQLLTKELGREIVDKLDMHVVENLRFHKGEAENSKEYAQDLAVNGDVYVNDAFGSCHREDTSIVALPQQFKAKNRVAAGLHLVEEVETLGRVLGSPKRPVVFVLGGGKADKAVLVGKILERADWVLLGGVLPKHIKSYCRESDGGVCVSAARLTVGAEDITPPSARNFAEIIRSAGTVVWNGPVGDVDNGAWDGTEVVAQAVSESDGFKVVGGGDTIAALKILGLLEKMDYVSTGGGAMLEFLAYGDLPGLRALRE